MLSDLSPHSITPYDRDGIGAQWLRDLDAPRVAPAQGRRLSLWGALEISHRFERFVPELARMLDVTEAVAAEMLGALDDGLTFVTERVPGVEACWVQGGPAVHGCIRGFVRVVAGTHFPAHGHLGREEVLVLQGGMVLDTGHIARPSELTVAQSGSEHSFTAQVGGPDLLYFVVAREGITLGDTVIRHPDGPISD